METKQDFRAKAIAIMISVSALAIVGVQLFTALVVERDPSLLLQRALPIALVSSILFVLAGFFLWRGLGPLRTAAVKVEAGKGLSSEERNQARSAARRMPILVIVLDGAGFFLGPLISYLAAMISSPVLLSQMASAIVLELAVGFMVAIQSIVLIEEVLRDPLAAIGILSTEASSRRSFRSSLILAGVASVVLCGFFLVAVMTKAMTAAVAAATAAAAGGDAPAAGVSSYYVSAFLMLFVSVLWSALLFASIGRSLARRIDDVSSGIADLQGGSGDISGRIAIVADDEVGRLASSLNGLLDGIGGLISRIGSLSEDVRSGAESLAASAEHADKAVAGLDESLGVVSGAAQRQSEAVSGTEGDIERLVGSIDTVAARVADQASFVEQSSAAVSEMAANIASVSRTAERADELSRKLREASEEGGEALKASLAAVGEIEAASKSVREIIGVISKIAAQTNLLAMNAAIEAAHAGDAGRGFAVVADEVRGLAEGASKSAKDIEGLIRGMAEKIDRGASLGDRAGAAFGRIREGVAETGELVQTIAASMSEQKTGAEEILRSVNSLIEATHTIKDLTVDQKEESKAMAEAMTRIVAASNEIFEAIQEETGSTQALGRVISIVGAEASKNNERVKGLELAVSSFTKGSSASKGAPAPKGALVKKDGTRREDTRREDTRRAGGRP